VYNRKKQCKNMSNMENRHVNLKGNII